MYRCFADAQTGDLTVKREECEAKSREEPAGLVKLTINLIVFRGWTRYSVWYESQYLGSFEKREIDKRVTI